MTGRRIAFLFPGQGSQYPGMGRELAEAHPLAAATFAEADAALGESLSKLCFAGPESELLLTENTQPAILATSTAIARVLHAHDVTPAAVAGHSLGEYSALVAAGGLAFGDAIRLVRQRGRYMQEAVPVGVGAMAAIIGLAAADVLAICREAERGDTVVPANDNSPEQTVIAGHAAAVSRAVALAEGRGAKRAILLPVSAPFHSPLMAAARARLEIDLRRTAFQDLAVPLCSNVDATPRSGGDAAREALIRQVTDAVRWTESVRRLVADGIDTVIEVGPGKVLCGLVRRIDRSVALFNVEDIRSLERTLAGLREGS